MVAELLDADMKFWLTIVSLDLHVVIMVQLLLSCSRAKFKNTILNMLLTYWLDGQIKQVELIWWIFIVDRWIHYKYHKS